MTRVRSIVRGLLSLAALAGLLIMVPWALARWGHSPLDDISADDWWSQLTESVVSDRMVFGVLTVAAWAVWAIFAGSVVIETVAGLRGVQAPRLGLAGPLQRAARGLVIGVLLMLSIAHGTPPAFAGPLPHPGEGGPFFSRPAAATVIVDVPAAPPLMAANADKAQAAAPTGESATVTSGDVKDVTDDADVVVVQRHDTAWGIAETHLGDGMRWNELWDLNHGVIQPDGRAWTDPQIILVGWQLQLPPDDATDPITQPVPTSDGTSSEIPTVTPAAPPAPVSTVEPTMHVVVVGDTLSAIADRYLGDPGRYRDIFDANRDAEQPDGRHLRDPNLIVPGWHLIIPVDSPAEPAPPTPPSTTIPSETTTPPPSDTTNESPTTTTIPDIGTTPPPVTEPDSQPALTPTPPLTVPPTSPPPSSSPPSSSLPPTSEPLPAPPITAANPTVADSSTHNESPGFALTAVAGITGAAVLATGITLRLRWLRRRRATRGARFAHDSPANDLERAAIASADVPLVRWAGQHLARLIQALDRRTISAAPAAVELSADAGIELLWDQPQHAPTPPGWTATDGGWAWRHAYDPDAPVPADDLPAAIPGLVTVGVRDGRHLLIDLEAFGTITIHGPDEAADALARSIAVELACGGDLSDAYVTAVDLDTAPAGTRRLTVDDADIALTRLAGTHASNQAVLAHAGTPNSFIARVAHHVPIEATVVIARHLTADQLSHLHAITTPRAGVAAVITRGDTTGTAQIHINVAGTTARLEPLGIDFEPAALGSDTVDALRATVARLAVLPDESDLADTPEYADITEPSTNGHHDGHDPLDLVEFEPCLNGVTSNGHYSAPVVFAAPVDAGLNDDSDGLPEALIATDIESADDTAATLFDVESSVPDAFEMVVHVLGVPAIADRPEIKPRELILAVLLACRGGTVAASTAQDAIWGGKPVQLKTAWNLYGDTRAALGSFPDGTPVMPSTDRARGVLRLDRRVTTDLALLGRMLTEAREASSTEAIRLLRDALALIDGPPFDAAGYDWAHRDQVVADASTLIEQTVDLLVDLAVDADQLDVARAAIVSGLRGLPGDEQLYRRRMRLEAHAGNHAGVVGAYNELTVYLADLETRPSPTTTALYHELVRQPGPIR